MSSVELKMMWKQAAVACHTGISLYGQKKIHSCFSSQDLNLEPQIHVWHITSISTFSGDFDVYSKMTFPEEYGAHALGNMTGQTMISLAVLLQHMQLKCIIWRL
jgi:hypothetical protein